MATTIKALPVTTKIATVTSKGQVTIPVEIRRLLGAKTGDKLAFEPTPDGVKILRHNEENIFEKFRGIGNGISELDGGREAIIRYVREMRGHDEIDDLISESES
jgi:AbrB family looped-hinge helix DNA binding protein